MVKPGDAVEKLSEVKKTKRKKIILHNQKNLKSTHYSSGTRALKSFFRQENPSP
jgi:hypothetical protein